MTTSSIRDEHAPLTPLEQQAYDEQCRNLAIVGQRHNDAAALPWHEGDLCRLIADTGYWRRDRSHSHTELMPFLYARSGIRTPSTLERRLALVECFTLDDYLSHA